MSKHTPGPWRWSAKGEFHTKDGRDAPSLIGGAGYGVLSCDGPENGPSTMDGLLISVAPEMADDIQKARKICEQAMVSGRCEHARDLAKAVLKALEPKP